MKNEDFIIETFEEQEITFDFLEHDMMVNATEMARPFKKLIRHFLANESTQNFINALKNNPKFINKVQSKYTEFRIFGQDKSDIELDNFIIETRRGNHGGTYMCQDLAIYFAMWLSPDFAVWVTQTIQRLFLGDDPFKARKALINIPRLFQEIKTENTKAAKMRKSSIDPVIIESRKLLKFKLIGVETRIKSLIDHAAQLDLFDTPEEIGRRMIKLSQEKAQCEKEIADLNKMESAALDFEEYQVLQKNIAAKKDALDTYLKGIRTN